MTNTRKNVCKIANTLIKNGFNRSEAFKKAWLLVKLPPITTKVKGTASADKRQEALEHLTRYNPSEILFRVAPETDNEHDHNAIAVITTVKNKGSFKIGYLPRELSLVISPLLRSGVSVYTSGTVTGGYYRYMNYGASLNLSFTN